MKRVALLGPAWESKGGVNVLVKHLGKFFTQQGVEVHYFPVGKTTLKESAFFHPVNTDAKKEQIKQLLEKLNNFKFNLIIANNLRTSYILSLYSKQKDINDLYIIHQGRILQDKIKWFHFKQKRKFNKIFKNKKVVLLNHCSKNAFIKKFQIKANYFVIPNGLDFEEIRKKASQFSVKGNYIIGVGRLEKEKNFEYLIKAYGAGNFKEELWLLGDGPQQRELENLAKKLKIENKVKFLGWQKNPYPFIKNASLLVHPSKMESSANVFVESFILNTPVVATDIKCGPNEILIGELEKYLVPLNNIPQLTYTMEKALENYPPIKEKYIEKYRVEKVGEQYLQFL
jgi:glycosyltransferase involved in cell wall biosynthesis